MPRVVDLALVGVHVTVDPDDQPLLSSTITSCVRRLAFPSEGGPADKVNQGNVAAATARCFELNRYGFFFEI